MYQAPLDQWQSRWFQTPDVKGSTPLGRTSEDWQSWVIATVLKTVGRKSRGFESHILLQWRGDRVVYDGILLRCWAETEPRGFKSHPRRHIPPWTNGRSPDFESVVPDLRTLDTLVKAGLKPSQIIVTSEFNNTSRFDAMDIWRYRCHY